MLAKHQAVVDNTSSLGVMTSTKPFTIPAHDCVVFHGQTRVKVVCQKLTVCLDGASGLPKRVIATPSVSCISLGQAKSKLPVELVNHLFQDVTIPAKARICDLYSTEDVDLMEDNKGGEASYTVSNESDSNFLKNFLHMNDQFPVEQVEEMQQLLLKWKSVFFLHDLELCLTDKAEHCIHLKDDTPFKEKPRPIPPSMFAEVQKSQSSYASNVVVGLSPLETWSCDILINSSKKIEENKHGESTKQKNNDLEDLNKNKEN